MNAVIAALIVTLVITLVVGWVCTVAYLGALAFPYGEQARPKMIAWAAATFVVGLFIGTLAICLAIGPQS